MNLPKLGAEVAASLDEARASEEAVAARARVRERIVQREPSSFRGARPVRLRVGRVVGALAVAAALPLAWFVARPPVPVAAVPALPQALSFVVGADLPGVPNSPIAAASTATPLVFSDGSRVRLDPAARVRVAEVAPNGARVRVEEGTVHVAVVHRDDTRWALEAGPFEVRVTGTKFDLEWNAKRNGLVVRLEEGSVVVRGCEEERTLRAGDVLDVTCSLPPRGSAPTSSSDFVAPAAPPALEDPRPSGGAPSSPATAVAASSATAVVAAKAPGSRDDGPGRVIGLAKKGAHTEALMAAEANGFESTCDALGGPDLLVLADASRYAGRFDRAIAALSTTRQRFPSSDSAAAAAFELGRIEMDIKRDLGAAGEHFETYLRERPAGSLAREALGRALEARQRSGETARAERLAVRYLAAYPDGPHAKLARKVADSREAP